MNTFHKDLTNKWDKLPLVNQMANIGAEVGRAINWRRKNNMQMSQNAFYRALELIDFTINDKKNINSLKEICRVREVLVDYFAGKNIYHSNDKSLNKYFYYFNLVSAL